MKTRKSVCSKSYIVKGNSSFVCSIIPFGVWICTKQLCCQQDSLTIESYDHSSFVNNQCSTFFRNVIFIPVFVNLGKQEAQTSLWKITRTFYLNDMIPML